MSQRERSCFVLLQRDNSTRTNSSFQSQEKVYLHSQKDLQFNFRSCQVVHWERPRRPCSNVHRGEAGHIFHALLCCETSTRIFGLIRKDVIAPLELPEPLKHTNMPFFPPFPAPTTATMLSAFQNHSEAWPSEHVRISFVLQRNAVDTHCLPIVMQRHSPCENWAWLHTDRLSCTGKTILQAEMLHHSRLNQIFITKLIKAMATSERSKYL